MRRRLACLALLLLAPSQALAGGCAPVPADSAGLPPCCATTDMRQGGRCMAPAVQYQFTIASFGFEKSDGTELRFGSPRVFDAAGVSAGAAMGDYLSGIELPTGSYVALRPILSQQIAVRANSLTRDGRRCQGSLTAPAARPDGTPWPVCTAGQPDSGTPVCAGNGQLKLRDSRAGTLLIGGNNSLTLNFQFDVNNGVVCDFAPGNGPNRSLTLGVLAVKITKS